MVVCFTQVAESAAFPDKQPAYVALALYDLRISRSGLPTQVTINNGTDFSQDFAHMLARLGIHHVHSSAYHPASNGVVDLLVKSVKSILAARVIDHPRAWI